MRMLQARRCADFTQETFAAERAAEVGVQHFDRNLAIMLAVVREVHRVHPAGAEFLDDDVAIHEGGRQPRLHIRHGRSDEEGRMPAPAVRARIGVWALGSCRPDCWRGDAPGVE